MGRRLFRIGSLGLAGAAALALPAALAQQTTGAPSPPASGARRAPVVRIGGSSTVFPILQAAEKAYRDRREDRPVVIELNESGTTDGFRQFCRGLLPIANASRPISSRELRACKSAGVTFIELPIAFDAVTVVVHPSNPWARTISTRQLSRLWRRAAQGRVTRWKQVDSSWPDRPIRLCGPGADSGTFDYFNKAINGDPADSRTDYTASEDDSVIVRCVARDPAALGYFGYAYYAANTSRLRALPIVAGPRGPVAPSVANVQNGRYQPLSRPLFLYVNDRALRERAEVRGFVTFLLQHGLDFVRQAGFVPLPDSTYRVAETKLYRHVLGTAFGGDLPVGLSIGEALRRSFDRQTRRPGYW